MNRLKIVQKYMTLKTKVIFPEKYNKAQNLSKKIVKKQNIKINTCINTLKPQI